MTRNTTRIASIVASLLAVALGSVGCSSDKSSRTAPEDRAPCPKPSSAESATPPKTPVPPAEESEAVLRFVLLGGEVKSLATGEMATRIAGGLETLTVDHPVYKQEKTYRGYWLRDVMATAGFEPLAARELIFHCSDGYAPSLPSERLAAEELFLAVEQVGAPGGAKWEKVRIGKEYLSPAPFYVIGRESASYKRFPWPLQVERIEALGTKPDHALAYPQGAAAGGPVARGFDLFKTFCLACHSMNLQGGRLGPELNIPRNITEYWATGTLREFIGDPSAFRAKSKMPSFPQLGKGDMDAVMAYLDYMKEHKRPPRDTGTR